MYIIHIISYLVHTNFKILYLRILFYTLYNVKEIPPLNRFYKS